MTVCFRATNTGWRPLFKYLPAIDRLAPAPTSGSPCVVSTGVSVYRSQMSSMATGAGFLLGADVAAASTKRGASRRFGARDAMSILPARFSPAGATGRRGENTRFRKTVHLTVTAKAKSHRVVASSVDTFGGDLPPEEIKQMQQKTLGMMFASYASVYFVRKPFSVVKAPMQDALNLSTATIAGIDSSFLALYAIGQLTLPALGDKIGARKMLVVGYLLSAAACFGFGLTSYPILLAGEKE